MRLPYFISILLCTTLPLAAQPATTPTTAPSSYESSLRALHDELARKYPCFQLKQIDWPQVGRELLPQAAQCHTDEQFGLLCLQMLARLQDAHSVLQPGTARPPVPPLPAWDPGFACLIDDHDRPVVYYIDRNGPARKQGVRIGMAVVSINGKPAQQAMDECAKLFSTYYGYSSRRQLLYDVAHAFTRQMQRGAKVRLVMEDPTGTTMGFELPADLGIRYVPRLPVPIPKIQDSGTVSWTQLGDDIGYIYVRRIAPTLPQSLDKALAELGPMRGLVIDVRGNSGGGFDGAQAFVNFEPPEANPQPNRPRYTGPIAILIDQRCISAGEGWTSWFVARKRARLFGTATAGASSSKQTYTLPNGLYKVTFSVRSYRGFLNRPIEVRGLEPDVPVRCNAADLAAGRDTVLEAAKTYLLNLKP